jgi:hypothetical protein
MQGCGMTSKKGGCLFPQLMEVVMIIGRADQEQGAASLTIHALPVWLLICLIIFLMHLTLKLGKRSKFWNWCSSL